MYGEVGTDQIYDSFASKVRLRDQQDLYYNEDIYQTIFPPKQPRLSLADAFSINKQNKRKAPIDELLTTEDKYLVSAVKSMKNNESSIFKLFKSYLISGQFDYGPRCF